MPTSISDTDDLRVRTRRLKRRKQAHQRSEAAKARRQQTLAAGQAASVTVREFAQMHGVSEPTVRRRCADGTLRWRKLGSRVLIDAVQPERPAS
jgi:excisionase family DNA binding protein